MTVHLQYGCAFVGVDFYYLACDHNAQELVSTAFEGTFKDMVHQPLISGAYIFKAKGHDLVAKVDICNDECCFLLLI